MERFYQIIGYERHNTHLVERCRYPVPKEYVALAITDQETMETVFFVGTPSCNNLEIYIDASVENPSRVSVPPHESNTPTKFPSFMWEEYLIRTHSQYDGKTNSFVQMIFVMMSPA